MSNREAINELLRCCAEGLGNGNGFDLVVERGTETTSLPYGIFWHVATSEYEMWSGTIPLEHTFAVTIYDKDQKQMRTRDDLLQQALVTSPAFVRSVFVREEVDVDPEGPIKNVHILERHYVFKARGEVCVDA